MILCIAIEPIFREKKTTWGWKIGISSALLAASLVTFGISFFEFFRFLIA